MADPKVQSLIETLQFCRNQVDLTSVMRSSHGEYRYGLHIVIESDSDWHEVRADVLQSFRTAFIDTCKQCEWRLARIGLLSNHFHILVGPRIDDSPSDVAMAFLNAQPEWHPQSPRSPCHPAALVRSPIVPSGKSSRQSHAHSYETEQSPQAFVTSSQAVHRVLKEAESTATFPARARSTRAHRA
jgi:hypothetical protein